MELFISHILFKAPEQPLLMANNHGEVLNNADITSRNGLANNIDQRDDSKCRTPNNITIFSLNDLAK